MPKRVVEVRTVSHPAHWLTTRIASDRTHVVNILPEGAHAASWQPDAELVASLADVDLIVANGAGYEAWMATAALPEDRVVHTAQGLELISLEQSTHSHGAEGEHSHAGTAPHTWGDPNAFIQQARTLGRALAAVESGDRAATESRVRRVDADLRALAASLAGQASALREVRFASNQAAFNYLSRRLGMDIHAFDLSPNQEPTKEALSAVNIWIGEDPQKRTVLLWEQAPSDAVKAALPEQLDHVLLDPLEGPRGAPYDYLVQAKANVEVLRGLHTPPSAP
jgi:zinc transport system substrate-binding protein